MDQFLKSDPRDCWDERFAFIPTQYGTNDFIDELFSFR